jgi:hypothetical protein
MQHTVSQQLVKWKKIKYLNHFLLPPLTSIIDEYAQRDPGICNNVKQTYNWSSFSCIQDKDGKEEVYQNIPMQILSQMMHKAEEYSGFEEFGDAIHHIHYRPIENAIYVHWRKDAFLEGPDHLHNPISLFGYWFPRLNRHAFERACMEMYPVTTRFKHFERNLNHDIVQMEQGFDQYNRQTSIPVEVEECIKIAKVWQLTHN